MSIKEYALEIREKLKQNPTIGNAEALGNKVAKDIENSKLSYDSIKNLLKIIEFGEINNSGNVKLTDSNNEEFIKLVKIVKSKVKK